MISNALTNAADKLNLTLKCYQQIYIYNYSPCPLLPWPRSYIYLSSDTTVTHHVLLFPCFIDVPLGRWDTLPCFRGNKMKKLLNEWMILCIVRCEVICKLLYVHILFFLKMTTNIYTSKCCKYEDGARWISRLNVAHVNHVQNYMRAHITYLYL